MWHRPQSLLLSVAALCLGGSLYAPLWQKLCSGPSGAIITLDAFALSYAKGDIVVNIGRELPYPIWSIGAIISFGIALSVVIILRYKYRPQQMRLCGFNFLAIASALFVSFYFSQQAEVLCARDLTGDYQWGIYLLMGALLCNWIARLLILRDERLVQSANSLR